MSSEYITRTACRGCHGVCQVLVHHDGQGKITRITGDKDSPTSRGYICPKGAYAAETVYHPDRLTRPKIRRGKRGEGKWDYIGWDEATDMMAEKFSKIIEESGPEYLAIGQGTARSYLEFTAKFSNALGTPNFVNPGHNCFVPRIICSSISLGFFPQPDIYALGGEMPKSIMVLGSNAMGIGGYGGYCSRMEERAMRNAEFNITVDPRKTRAASISDIHMIPRPGAEIAIILGMIHSIIKEETYDKDFVTKYCHGFDELKGHMEKYTPEWAAKTANVEVEDIKKAAHVLSTKTPSCIFWGNGIDLSVNAFQAGRASLILMALCGSLDVPGGMVQFVAPNIREKSASVHASVTGMHLLPEEQKKKVIGPYPFCPGAHPPAFWQACVDGKPYRPRAMWLVGTNPILTATRGDLIQKALRDHLEFVVASDLFMTPTVAMADLVLPASHWLEQDDVVHFHKIWCVHLRRKLAQIGEARDDRHVILELARKMGMTDIFPWKDWYEYLDWIVEPMGMDFKEFNKKDIYYGDMKYRKYEDSGFKTPSGKVELFSNVMKEMGLDPMPIYEEPPVSPISSPEIYKEYPFYFISGCKSIEYFHTEGQNIKSLRRLNPDPLVEMNPADAESLGLENGEWVKVSTPWGSQKFKLSKTDTMPEKVVHAQHARWYPEEKGPDFGCFTSNVNLLFPHDYFDKNNGAESLKSFLCKVEAL